jgi:predicted O-methyltransferase YrrM
VSDVEMRDNQPGSDEAFVEECYQRFLRRPADEVGMAFYAGRLREGASRMDVVQTFVTGREFFSLLCKGDFGGDLVTPFLAFAPPGHYYSPLPSPEDVTRYASAAFARGPETLHGVDLDVAGQRAMVETLGPLTRDLHFDADRGGATRYYWDNDGFGPGDAVALAAMMRHARPKRIIEVGAGYSTAVMLDVAERYLAAPPLITCIDPEPMRLRSLLREGDADRLEVREAIVQDLPVSFFTSLEPGDILFIDSSHVLKLGSDVSYLLLEVVPQLAPGVLIHVHDIACSFDYPLEWYEEGRAWNEAPTLRAFLMFNQSFRILYFSDYLMRFERELMAAHMPLALRQPKSVPEGNTSVSFWMMRDRP